MNLNKNRKKSSFRGPVFIVGCGRSGTTMLVNILNSNDYVKIIQGETNFLENVYGNRLLNGGLDSKRCLSKLNQYLDNRKKVKKDGWNNFTIEDWNEEFKRSNKKDYSNLYLSLMHIFAKSNYQVKDDIYLGSKNPMDLLYINKILELFPKAKIINIVRDCRAVTASMINSRGHPDNVVDAASIWKYCINKTNQFINKKSNFILTIYYEKLLKNPEETLRNISDFLGVPFQSKMLNLKFSKKLSSFDKNASDGYDTSRIDRYKSVLSQKNIDLIESIAFNELKKCGYSVNIKNRNLPLSLKFIIKIRYLKIILRMFFRKYMVLFGFQSLSPNKILNNIKNKD